MKNPILIAEIGCNHQGNLEKAKEFLTTLALFCKATHVKFQKRNPLESLTQKQYKATHPNQIHSFGETYGAHREFLEFDLTEHKELKQFCDDLGLVYSSSVWDLTSAKEIASLNPTLIKIPSACNNNFDILNFLCNNYNGEIHVSLGMTTQKEEEDLISFLEKQNRAKDTVLYSCTSGYPVENRDVCLLEILRLKNNYQNIIKEIGFSGHHKGFALDIAAYTLGANVIERHFTLDRTLKGTDHAASLEPDGFRRLNRDLKATAEALTYKNSDMLEVEMVQRIKLKNIKTSKDERINI